MALSDVYVSRPISVVTPVISSLAAVVKDYIVSRFPKGYFKDVWVDSELPALPGEGMRQRRRKLRQLTLSNVERREYPLLVIRVQPTAEDSEFSTGQTWFRNNQFVLDPMSMARWLQDDEAQRYGGVEVSRYTCGFTVDIVTSTEVQAWDAMSYLKRICPVNIKTHLNDLTIGTEVPPDILALIWKDMGLTDPKNPTQMERFTRYLRSASGGFMDKTVRAASGRTAFSWHYETNAVMTIPGDPSVSTERTGTGVVRRAMVEMPLTLDLPVPTLFGYRQEEIRTGDLPALNEIEFGLTSDGGVFMGTAFRARPPYRIDEYLSLCYFTGLVTGSEPGVEEVTDFTDAIDADLKAYVDFMLGEGPFDGLAVRTKLWRDTEEVPQKDWSFDYDEWKLTIKKPFLNYKYHFGIYVDTGRYAEMARQNRVPVPSPYDEA